MLGHPNWRPVVLRWPDTLTTRHSNSGSKIADVLCGSIGIVATWLVLLYAAIGLRNAWFSSCEQRAQADIRAAQARHAAAAARESEARATALEAIYASLAIHADPPSR